MSLLFSSHLLPDVEAVCDYVVVLGSGKLLAEGKIQELKQVHDQCFDVRLKADAAPFAARLAALGCAAERHDDLLRVRIPAGRSPQLLWEVAADDARANSLSAAAAQHARRSLLECRRSERRGAAVMPIFDQGYQHWSGELSGHAWRWLAITRHGVRVALVEPLDSRRSDRLPCCRPSCWPVVLCVWGLLERQSDLIASILPFISLIPRPADPRRAARLSRRNLDALLQLFPAHSSCGFP